MSTTTVESVTERMHRMKQIDGEMVALCQILDSLQERSEFCVDEIQNGLGFFDGDGLDDAVKERFKRLERFYCCG